MERPVNSSYRRVARRLPAAEAATLWGEIEADLAAIRSMITARDGIRNNIMENFCMHGAQALTIEEWDWVVEQPTELWVEACMRLK